MVVHYILHNFEDKLHKRHNMMILVTAHNKYKVEVVKVVVELEVVDLGVKEEVVVMKAVVDMEEEREVETE